MPPRPCVRSTRVCASWQVGASAAEWAASLAAVQHLAEPAASSSSGSRGCAAASALLSELSQVPCFLLMEFVKGRKLSECPQALDPVSVQRRASWRLPAVVLLLSQLWASL
jgi:hypothetical protein